MEDTKIIDLYWQRSDRAIPETDRKYGSYCHAVAYNICHDREDAEECVNDTYLRAWNSMPDERPSMLRAFLGTISRNLALDRYRRVSRNKRGGGEVELALAELDECVPSLLTVERQILVRELSEAIDSFLSALSETDRTVFVSRYWYLASVAEISERLGCSQGKVKMMLHRTRERLRNFLKEEGLA